MPDHLVTTINLIDDSDDEVFMTRIFLKREHVSVDLLAFYGFDEFKDHLQKSRTFDPKTSLTVFDLNLTNFQGTEAIRELRCQSWPSPIIAGISTGSDDPADKKLAQEAGADFFVEKPLNRTALQSIASSVDSLSLRETADGHLQLFRHI